MQFRVVVFCLANIELHLAVNCPALGEPQGSAGVYDVSACTSVAEGASCNVGCIGARLGGTTSCSCIAPQNWVCASGYPTCLEAALQPTRLVATGARQSVKLSWLDTSLRDCGSRGLFTSWQVQQSTGGAFSNSGAVCDSLTCSSVTECTLTGLSDATSYDFRVSAQCSETGITGSMDSSNSVVASATTFPNRAGQPTAGAATNPTVSTSTISWTAGASNGCSFSHWDIEIRNPTESWTNAPLGCQDLYTLSTTTCTLEELPCGTNYLWRVTHRCTDPNADSIPSATSEVFTLSQRTCMLHAGTPVTPFIFMQTYSTGALDWTPGQPNDCTFKMWEVRMQSLSADGASQLFTPTGCTALFSRYTYSCIATGLTEKYYRFAVREVCETASLSSPFSAFSAWFPKVLQRSVAPTLVWLSDAQQTSLKVSWIGSELNDCVFSSWRVSVQVGQASYQQNPTGCGSIRQYCVQECVLTGLTSNTAHKAKVSVVCDESTSLADSTDSSESIAIQTLVQPATMPTSFSVSNVVDSAADFDWIAATASPDCSFKKWIVEVQESQSSSWYTPSGCDVTLMTSRSTLFCGASFLPCGTAFVARVRESCVDSAADGPYRYSASFTTTGTCFKNAKPPVGMSTTNPTASSLFVSFLGGEPMDCTFFSFEVQKRTAASSDTDWSLACTDISIRTGPSCTVNGLAANTEYYLRVRETCTQTSLNSAWVAPHTPFRTLAVDGLSVADTFPLGTVTESSPTQVVLIFSSPIMMPSSQVQATFWATGCQNLVSSTQEILWGLEPFTSVAIEMEFYCNKVKDSEANTYQTEFCCGQDPCSPSCTRQTALSEGLKICPTASGCGCSGTGCTDSCTDIPYDTTAGIVSLLDNKVMTWEIPTSLQIRPFCTYSVSIAEGFVRTVATPATFLTAYSWSFTYSPSGPAIADMTLTSSTQTMLVIAITFDVPSDFSCITVPGSINSGYLEYTGVGAVSMYLSGLTPSTSYDIRCTSYLAGTRVQSVQTRGSFSTDDDTNGRLSSLVITGQRICNQAQLSGNVNPFLNPLFETTHDGGTYEVKVDVAEYRTQCGESATLNITAFYRIRVAATLASKFATLVYDPPSQEVAMVLPWQTETIPASVTQNMKIEVWPKTGGKNAAVTFNLQVTALYQDFIVEQTSQSNGAGQYMTSGSSAQSVSVNVMLPQTSSSTAVDVSTVNIYFGGFLQSQTSSAVTTSSAYGQATQRSTLTISSPTGYGIDLPVIISWGGSSYQSKYTVSFNPPVLTMVSTSVGGQPTVFASTVESTVITVSGFNLGQSTAAGGAAQIYVTNRNANTTSVRRPYYLSLGFDSNFQGTLGGNYKLVKPQFPLAVENAEKYAELCNRTAPLWIGSAAVLCWSTVTGQADRWKVWYSTTSGYSSYGEVLCNHSYATDGWKDPRNCDSPTGYLQTITDGAPELYSLTELSLSLTSDYTTLAGIYALSLAGDPIWASSSAQYTGCDASKHKWVHGNAVFCWLSNAYSLLHSVSGAAATSIGTLSCATYNADPTQCGGSVQGALTSVVIPSPARRLTSGRRLAYTLEGTIESNGYSNLCGATTFVSSTQITCTLSPTLTNPLHVDIAVRNGAGTWLAATSANPMNNGESFALSPPLVSSIDVPTQPISSRVSFTVTGEYFPANTLTFGFMQLFASPETTISLPVDTSTHVPLCTQMVQISSTVARCDRYSNWDGSTLRTTRPNVWMQVSETLISQVPMSNVLDIPQIRIYNLTKSDNYEVGTVTYTLIGEGFGGTYADQLELLFISEGKATRPDLGLERRLQSWPTRPQARRLTLDYSARSGLMNSTCVLNTRNDTHIVCQLKASSIFGEALGDLDYAYVHSLDDPAPAYPVKLRARFANMPTTVVASGGSLLQGFFNFSVELFTCGPGYHRASKTNRTCNICEYGKHSDRYTAELVCPNCPIGRFANYRQMITCVECAPENYSTVNNGSIYRTQCLCAPGYERDRTRPRSDGPWDTGVCELCPANAGCDGGDTRAYSLAGYWTPNRKKFWTCSPRTACIRGNPRKYNLCETGRHQASRRCSECASKYYRYRAECYFCNEVHTILGYALPGAVLFISFFIVIPLLIKHNQRQHAVLEVIGEGVAEEDEEDDENLYGKKAPKGAAVGQRNYGRQKKRDGCCTRCAKTCNPARRWAPHKWPRIIKQIVTRPKTRLLMLMMSRGQLLWALIMMPVDWPESVYFLRELVLSAFMVDFNVLRVECIVDVNYYVKFFVQWSAPFLFFLIFAMSLRVASWWWRNKDHPKYIYFTGTLMESLSFLICILTTGHFAADLNFLRCEPCEDSPRHCLVDFPALGCAVDELWWLTLAGVSIADLVLVVMPCLSFVFLALYKSWCWQHGAGSGLDKRGKKLWHLYVADFWVKDYKGYSQVLRDESVHLREYLKKILHRGLDGRSVWQRCVFRSKMRKWYLTEQKVDGQVSNIINAANKSRKIQDAKVMNKEEEDRHDGDHRLFVRLCLCLWWIASNVFCCKCCLKSKDAPRQLKIRARKKWHRRCLRWCKQSCSTMCTCIFLAPVLICRAILACLCPEGCCQRSRHKRENPYRKKKLEKNTSDHSAYDDELEEGRKLQMTLREEAEEAARINELSALEKFKAAKVKKKQDMKKLLRLLSSTEEFILENELGKGILNRQSMFWAYTWEYTMLWQKLLTIIVSTFAPSTGYPQEAIACCMFFQLVVMVIQIDIEPFEWNLLNDISMTADIITFYLILFSQLKWTWSLAAAVYALVGVVTVPTVIRFMFPALRIGKTFDEDGHIVDIPSAPRSLVELAVFEEALGVNGMRLFRRAQQRWRRMHEWKTFKGNGVDNSELRRMLAEKEQQKKLKEKFKGREHVVDKLDELPKALKGPVETVLKVGWGKVNWPSNFTAVHLAANLGSKEGIEILAEAKANLTSEDAWNHTALDYADSGGYQEVSDLILKLAPSAYRSTPIEAPNDSSTSKKEPQPKSRARAKSIASNRRSSSNRSSLRPAANDRRTTDEKVPLVQSAQSDQYLSPERLPGPPQRRPKNLPKSRAAPSRLGDDFPPQQSLAAPKSSPRRSSSRSRGPAARSAAQGNVATVHRMSVWHDEGTDGHVARNLLAREAQEQAVNPDVMRARRKPAGRGKKAAAAERAESPSAAVHNF